MRVRISLAFAVNLIMPLGFLFNSVFVQAEEHLSTTFEVLLIGNSHSSKAGLPKALAQLIEIGAPGATVNVENAGGWKFLAEHLRNKSTRKKLESGSWTHVVLQAQKYSSSGRYYYPTDAAEEWIRRVRSQGAKPILFPEWARRGNNEEGPRVQKLHQQISARAPACVAPVGLAWEQVKQQEEPIRLHAADGNHANRNGALLAAYVLYEVITGQHANDLPYIENIKVDAATQQRLRLVATDTVAANPPC